MKFKSIVCFFFNQGIIRKVLSSTGVLFAIVIFNSCSNEDELTNKSEINKTTKESDQTTKKNNAEIDVPISVQENLNSFSEQIFANAESLDIALYKNNDIEFDAQAMQMLSAATNENDLKVVFEMAGIANSQEVIDILKRNVVIQQAFISQNPGFYNLTLEKQTQLLNESIELTRNSYNSQVPVPPNQLTVPSRCAKDFNTNIDDCAEDFGVCATGAVIGSAWGIWPGVVAAAGCMVTKLLCDRRAKRDYKECVITPMGTPGTPSPPTGELWIRCTQGKGHAVDSCWTEDSNGKFVERIN